MSITTLRRIAAVASTAAIATLGLAAPAAAAGAGNLPSIGSFAFAQAHVDATAGNATNTMTWSVRDKASGASTIWGDLSIRQQGAQSGTYVGPTYHVTFGTSWDGTIEVLASSGDAHESSYTYALPVPQYTNAADVRWVVTQVSLRDDLGQTHVTGTPHGGSYTATDLVDSNPPSYDQLGLDFNQADTVYTGAGAAPVTFFFYVTDMESGLAGGTLNLSGPNGATVTQSFEVIQQDGLPTCGTDENGDNHNMLCEITATIPTDAATGPWALTRLDLTDVSGNTLHGTDLTPVDFQVTRNAAFQAGNFAITPTVADNWQQSAPLTLTMDTTGATGGISSVDLKTACYQNTTTPTDLGSGKISVPLMLFQRSYGCDVTGIKLTDGAGHISVYGADYHADPLSLQVKELPDTVAPIATSAHLSDTTFQVGGGRNLLVYADVVSHVGVVGMSATVYDVNGNPVGGGYGGVDDTTDGEVNMLVTGINTLPVGTYTVGFIINDAGYLSTPYGAPNQPVPAWGTLTFTVTN